MSQTNRSVRLIGERSVAVDRAARLLSSSPLAHYYEREDFPGPAVQTDDEFSRQRLSVARRHFIQDAPADSAWAVVDDQLPVHGLQNLRVNGASIMPRMKFANLNASTMMIADKASDLIRGRKLAEADEGERGDY